MTRLKVTRGAVVGAFVVLATGGALATSALGGAQAPKYSPVQSEVRQRDEALVRRDLASLPAVKSTDLAVRDRAQFEAVAPMPEVRGLVASGKKLGSRGDRAVFDSVDGTQACIIGRGSAACMPVSELSPHFEFGYDPASGQTSISVTALGGVSDIKATTSVSTAVPLKVQDGEAQFTLTGELRRVTWVVGGQIFAQDFPAGASVAPGDQQLGLARRRAILRRANVPAAVTNPTSAHVVAR